MGGSLGPGGRDGRAANPQDCSHMQQPDEEHSCSSIHPPCPIHWRNPASECRCAHWKEIADQKRGFTVSLK
eukprot:100328-Amphidinium_carterae.1